MAADVTIVVTCPWGHKAIVETNGSNNPLARCTDPKCGQKFTIDAATVPRVLRPALPPGNCPKCGSALWDGPAAASPPEPERSETGWAG